MKTLWILFSTVRVYNFCKSKTQVQRLLWPTARVKLLFPSRYKSSDRHQFPLQLEHELTELGDVSDGSWGTACCCHRYMGCIVCLLCQVLPFGSSSFSMDCTWNFTLQNTLKLSQQEFTNVTPAVEGGLIFHPKLSYTKTRTHQKKTLKGEVTCFFSSLVLRELQDRPGASLTWHHPK